MSALFDVERLYVTLDARRRKARLQWRDIATETGVSASTFTRMGLHGQNPSVENLTRMLAWLGDTDLKPYIREEKP